MIEGERTKFLIYLPLSLVPLYCSSCVEVFDCRLFILPAHDSHIIILVVLELSKESAGLNGRGHSEVMPIPVEHNPWAYQKKPLQ